MAGRRLEPGSETARRAATRGPLIDFAAGRALIAHDAADEDDRLAVRRPTRHSHLLLDAGLVDGAHLPRLGGAAAVEANGVELGDPPVVVARPARGGGCEAAPI